MTQLSDLPDVKPASTRRRPTAITSIERVDLLSVTTLVLWLATLVVGATGLLAPERALPAATQPEEPPTQVLDVQLGNPLPLPLTSAPPQQPTVTPATPALAAAPPPLPTLTAARSPTVAYAVPVTGPLLTVGPMPATLSRAEPVAASPVQQLTYGQGEGRQPAPVYPPQAVSDEQQGVVVVRFVVDPAGTVQVAQASSPCPWPLLNEAAVRAVRATWHFPPGRTRSYEVAIRFQLRQL